MTMVGKTVVVTGASRGIGRAIAKAFTLTGATVALWGRTLQSVEAAAAAMGPNAFAVQCDVAVSSAINAAFDATLARTGRVDVFINNAGMSGVAAPFLTMTEAQWDGVMEVNLKGPMLASQLAARHMAERGAGVILHNASIAANGVDGPFSHYSASKAGLLALMRSMAVELAVHGIRVNAVSPGYTRTEMTTSYFGLGNDEMLATGFLRVPIGRLVTPEEVAAAFVFLASNAGSGITGTNLVVDGGLTANLYIMETIPNAI